ncbi:Nicotinamidase/isochorismatase family protein [Caballeronia glathei]|jgi:nicotinamidase-related amidase|uniref:Isochorismatase n=1 Tax=Caballeronia glathei TaxID=60547 RepID=A0A069PQF8_9BURK|nr:hydrolase [Caballeronia glathei]KDR39541.1 isochorismatase [Caballeronia glathei]CDY78225.1 Nicotinamidase/isochorismatase family protein [Caballeronia glathei]
MNNADFKLQSRSTALVLIDLQAGITALPVQPNSAADVLANARALADRFRALDALVVLVKVAYPAAPGGMRPITEAGQAPLASEPAGWSELCPELAVQPSDIVITKRQWGAFYGTELDLQLRRRGIDTIVLGGIATHIGVESTARAAYEHGYQQIFVEDAMSDLHADTHESTFRYVFPRIGRIRSTAQVVAALE